MKKMYKYILLFILIMFGFVGEVRALGDCVNGKTTGTNNRGIENCDIICERYTSDDKKVTIFREYTETVQQNYYMISFDEKVNMLYTKFSIFNPSFLSPGAKKVLESDKCPEPLNIYYNNGLGTLGNKYCVDNDGKWCISDNRFSTDEKVKLKENSKNDDKKNDKKDNSNSKTLCSYNESFGEAYIYLYKDESLKVKFSWSRNSNKEHVYDIDDGRVFMEEDAYKNLSETKSKKSTEKVICPKYVYKDTDYQNEICFDSDGETCKGLGTNDHFEEDEKYETTPESNYTYGEVNDFKQPDNNLTGPKVEELLKTNYGIENIMEICAFSKEDVKNPDVDQIFVVNDTQKYTYFKYSGDELSKMKLSEDGDKIKYKSSCVQLKKIHYREERKELVDHYNLVFDSDAYLMQWWHFGESSLVYEDIGPIETCEDLLGVDLINEINSYMLYIKVAVPILIIVLGSIDFGKAFIASDEDAMKKAQKRFMMRIMIGMVIFFIPSIVKILLNIANQVWGVIGSDTCGIMF